MFNIFMTAVNAVVPIVALIALGYILKRVGFLTKNFLEIGNKLVFDVALPCMLCINIYNIQDLSAINWGLVIFSVIAILVLFGFCKLFGTCREVVLPYIVAENVLILLGYVNINDVVSVGSAERGKEGKRKNLRMTAEMPYVSFVSRESRAVDS